MSVVDIPAHVDELSKACKERISEEFDKYGILITNFYTESINYPEDHPQVEQINQSQANKLQRDIEGFTYQQQRSFDVMDSAAQNEGSAGSVMGAGMGMGMGLGIGGAMGGQMGNMGSQLNTGQNQGSPPQDSPQSPPQAPPPPPSSTYFVLVNNKQEGPYNIEQLKSFIQNGQLLKDTLMWKQGMAEWEKAANLNDIQGLFNLSSPPPPPSPQP